jgi:hypothetical protein
VKDWGNSREDTSRQLNFKLIDFYSSQCLGLLFHHYFILEFDLARKDLPSNLYIEMDGDEEGVTIIRFAKRKSEEKDFCD